MRVQIIKCDGCGKEIAGNPYRIIIEEVDRETDHFNVETYNTELCSRDYCRECAEKMVSYALKLLGKKPAIINQEFEEAVQDMIASAKKETEPEPETEPKEEKQEEPKQEEPKQRKPRTPRPSYEDVKRLKNNGKTYEQIAIALGSSAASVQRTWYSGQKREKAEKESKNALPKPKPVLKKQDPLKVCTKTCTPCKYSVGGGYCDYYAITGMSREDKPGVCTHRELR